MSNLYFIEAEYLSIFNEIEDNGGELTPELEERLVIVKENFDAKLLNYCRYITRLESDMAYASQELNRIAEYRLTKAKIADRLKDTVLQALKLFGNKDKQKDIWRYEIGNFRLSTRKSTSTELTDPTVIEDRFKEISISKLTIQDKAKIIAALEKDEADLVITESIPLKPIKAAIEAGEVVEGAELKTNYSLNLR